MARTFTVLGLGAALSAAACGSSGGDDSDSDGDGSGTTLGSDGSPATTSGADGTSGGGTGGNSGSDGGTSGAPPTAEECERIPDEQSCLDAGCTAYVEIARNTHDGTMCGAPMPTQLCVLTQSGVLQQEAGGQTYTRDNDGATEVISMESAVCDLLGWELCPSDTPTDMGACACLLQENPCA